MTEIGNLHKNPIIITGANGGLGREVTDFCLRNNKSVIMACRNVNKAERIKQDFIQKYKLSSSEIAVLPLDLSSFDTIINFVDTIKRNNIKPVALVNNAGTIERKYKQNENGFELTLATNYLGPYLLTRLLLPEMPKFSSIVNTESLTGYNTKISSDLFSISADNYSQLGAYSRSKVALMYFTASLSVKTKGNYYVNAADPGIVDTGIITLHRWFDPLANILFRPLIRKPKKGAIPICKAFSAEQTGFIYKLRHSKPLPSKFFNDSIAEWLWNKTEEELSYFKSLS
ncbi:MAG: SDR family NAD(P)-dependent oxidoreductase [Lentimicrobiaceae bacterium]|nr:SDR family NAD(P)-dependent oxidoreductase [Lentimicrobiaceae bacterium]